MVQDSGPEVRPRPETGGESKQIQNGRQVIQSPKVPGLKQAGNKLLVPGFSLQRTESRNKCREAHGNFFSLEGKSWK